MNRRKEIEKIIENTVQLEWRGRAGMGAGYYFKEDRLAMASEQIAALPVDFNLNQTVLVKLNQMGLDELKRQHDDLRKRAPSLGEWSPPKTDEKGFCRFQLWVLMQTFGGCVSLGSHQPFETTIFLDCKS